MARSNMRWVADRYAEQSRQALAPFADSEYKRALLWVPDFVVAREKYKKQGSEIREQGLEVHQ